MSTHWCGWGQKPKIKLNCMVFLCHFHGGRLCHVILGSDSQVRNPCVLTQCVLAPWELSTNFIPVIPNLFGGFNNRRTHRESHVQITTKLKMWFVPIFNLRFELIHDTLTLSMRHSHHSHYGAKKYIKKKRRQPDRHRDLSAYTPRHLGSLCAVKCMERSAMSSA